LAPRMVKASYSQRSDGEEIVHHEKTLRLHREACEIIDNYPWETELKLGEETGEGGGFYFLLGDENGKHASYQFVPMDIDKGWLMLEVVLKKGTLGIFGKQTATVDFDAVTTFEAKDKIKDLFNHTVESLYAKYKG